MSKGNACIWYKRASRLIDYSLYSGLGVHSDCTANDCKWIFYLKIGCVIDSQTAPRFSEAQTKNNLFLFSVKWGQYLKVILLLICFCSSNFVTAVQLRWFLRSGWFGYRTLEKFPKSWTLVISSIRDETHEWESRSQLEQDMKTDLKRRRHLGGTWLLMLDVSQFATILAWT